MLTSESEVDERLRQMNRTFLESLEGLGGGRRRERRSSSRLEEDNGSERSSEPDPTLGRMSTEGSGGGGGGGGGRGRILPPPRPRLGSRSTSTGGIYLGGVQGSDEVLGRLSLDDERRRSRGR
jgi:autophagy-related protein 13